MNTLARNLHGVASNQQVTEPLQRNGRGDFGGALATKNQVTSNWISVEDRLPDHPNKADPSRDPLDAAAGAAGGGMICQKGFRTFCMC